MMGGKLRDLAAQALQRAIDAMAEVVTGDRPFFVGKALRCDR